MGGIAVHTLGDRGRSSPRFSRGRCHCTTNTRDTSRNVKGSTMRGGPELLTKPTLVINRKMHFNKQLMLRISRSAAALCLCLSVGMEARGQSENQAVTGAPFGIGK